MRIFFFKSQTNNIFFQSFSEKPSLFLEVKVKVPVFYMAYLRKSETKSIFVIEAPVISKWIKWKRFWRDQCVFVALLMCNLARQL